MAALAGTDRLGGGAGRQRGSRFSTCTIARTKCALVAWAPPRSPRRDKLPISRRWNPMVDIAVSHVATKRYIYAWGGGKAEGFGDAKNPLLVSVRSGAKFSMPGMMDTVLNLGLNDDTLQGLIDLSGNERF